MPGGPRLGLQRRQMRCGWHSQPLQPLRAGARQWLSQRLRAVSVVCVCGGGDERKGEEEEEEEEEEGKNLSDSISFHLPLHPSFLHPPCILPPHLFNHSNCDVHRCALARVDVLELICHTLMLALCRRSPVPSLLLSSPHASRSAGDLPAEGLDSRMEEILVKGFVVEMWEEIVRRPGSWSQYWQDVVTKKGCRRKSVFLRERERERERKREEEEENCEPLSLSLSPNLRERERLVEKWRSPPLCQPGQGRAMLPVLYPALWRQRPRNQAS